MKEETNKIYTTAKTKTENLTNFTEYLLISLDFSIILISLYNTVKIKIHFNIHLDGQNSSILLSPLAYANIQAVIVANDLELQQGAFDEGVDSRLPYG